MPFSEDTKDEVKRKAHFRCCICNNYFVEIHHIVPQAEGGSDDIDNSAPLCPTCHGSFGGNPDKRKVIRQMRDFWYERCEKSESLPDVLQFSKKLDGVYSKLEGFETNQEAQTRALNDLKGLFSDYYGAKANQACQADNLSDLITLSGQVTSGSVVSPEYGAQLGKTCANCGNFTSGYNPRYCSSCGTQFP